MVLRLKTFIFIKLSLVTVRIWSIWELQLYKNGKKIRTFSDVLHLYDSIMLHSLLGKWLIFHNKIQKRF